MVAIGWQRGGVAVVVEVDEALLNMAKRTQTRVAGRPHQRWRWGAAGEQNDVRLTAALGNITYKE